MGFNHKIVFANHCSLNGDMMTEFQNLKRFPRWNGFVWSDGWTRTFICGAPGSACLSAVRYPRKALCTTFKKRVYAASLLQLSSVYTFRSCMWGRGPCIPFGAAPWPLKRPSVRWASFIVITTDEPTILLKVQCVGPGGLGAAVETWRLAPWRGEDI